MSVYTEYDAYRRKPNANPEDFMRTCLARQDYPQEEIDSLVCAMADTVNTATENLRVIMESPAPIPTMKGIVNKSLKNLASTIGDDADLKPEEKKTFLERFFGWLTGSAWREIRRMTEALTMSSSDTTEEQPTPDDWDAFDPSKATLPESPDGAPDVDEAREIVRDYLVHTSCSHDTLALGESALLIEKALDDGPVKPNEVPQIIVDALVSNLLSEEEREFKMIAALDYFLRLTDGTTQGEQTSKKSLQLLAVKAAHDAFIQANDLKAGFKRLQNMAQEKLREDATTKEADNV